MHTQIHTRTICACLTRARDLCVPQLLDRFVCDISLVFAFYARPKPRYMVDEYSVHYMRIKKRHTRTQTRLTTCADAGEATGGCCNPKTQCASTCNQCERLSGQNTLIQIRARFGKQHYSAICMEARSGGIESCAPVTMRAPDRRKTNKNETAHG